MAIAMRTKTANKEYVDALVNDLRRRLHRALQDGTEFSVHFDKRIDVTRFQDTNSYVIPDGYSLTVEIGRR